MRENENESEFGKICIDALARLTADEERALLPGMTAADIEAARDQAKSQHGMTLEEGIEANYSRPDGPLDSLSEIFGVRINHLSAKDMAQSCLLTEGWEQKTPAEQLSARVELLQIIHSGI